MELSEHLKDELLSELQSTQIDPGTVPSSVNDANVAMIEMLEAKIVALKKIIIDIAGEDYLKHKGF